MKNNENKKQKKGMRVKVKKAGKETTKERGITLIALVITIIILLILAAVTIAALSGENGILSNASKAKEETEIANEKEQISLAYIGAVVEKKGEGDITSGDMNSQFSSNGTKAQASGNINVEFTESKRWYKISTDGSIKGPYEEGEIPQTKTLVEMYKQAEADGCLGGESCTNPEEHLHIGDYVDYKNPTSGTYPVQPEKSGVDEVQTYDVANNQLNWRVLGIDEETGGIKLIAGSPTKLNDIEGKDDPYLYMYGARAYLYGPDEMNKIGALYKNEYAEEARSISIDDINQALGIEDNISEYNIVSVLTGGQAAELGYEYNFSGYTPHGWINGDERKNITGTADGYVYVIGDDEAGETQEMKTVSVTNERLKSMLFDNLSYGHGRDYWLASSGVLAHPSGGFADFTPFAVCERGGMTMAGFSGRCYFNSGGGGNGGCYSVRPVVSLKSDVSEEQVPKIDDKEEENWNYNGGNWEVDVYRGENEGGESG